MLLSPETAPVAWDVLPLDGEQEEGEGGDEHKSERERAEEVKRRGGESGEPSLRGRERWSDSEGQLRMNKKEQECS